MTKRIISLLLAVLMVLSLGVSALADEEPAPAPEEATEPAAEPEAAPAETEEPGEGADEPAPAATGVVASGNCGPNGSSSVTWRLEHNNDYMTSVDNYEDVSLTLTISGTGPMENYVMGSGTRSAPWLDWDESLDLFYDNAISRIIIEDGVTSIGDDAFHNCGSWYTIRELRIPSTVTRIGQSAFLRTNITSVTIPDSVTEVGTWTFSDSSLTSVRLSRGLKKISDGMLSWTGIRSIEIPDSVTSVGSEAFKGCLALTAVEFPASVASVGKLAFETCTALTSVTFYNPACKLSDESGALVDLKLPANAVVRGYDGSTAQAYAKKYGNPFVSLGKAPGSSVTPPPAAKEGWQKENGKWYFYEDGVRVKNAFVDGGKYYVNGSGVMVIGWQKIDGVWYYFNTSGAMVTGWKRLINKWYWLDKTTGAMATGWQTIDGKEYWFNTSGAMVTGWQKIDGTWYYFESSGAMAKGWKKLSGKWYYLNETTGAMATGGPVAVSGKEYWFKSDGAMVTGWINLGGGDYRYADSSGALAKELWVKSAGRWYYLKDTGLMARNETLTIDGAEYRFSGAGVWMK